MRTLASLRVKRILAVCFLISVFAVASQASVITFVTPAGSSTGGGPVNASATLTTGAGFVMISLTDLEANPTDVAQLISDFEFTLNGGATTGTLGSQAGTLINIDKNGNATFPGGSPSGWQLNLPGGGVFQIDALGGGQPADLIIGPGNGVGVYTNANGSIAGNGPHNPFILDTGVFVVDIAGVTADTKVTSGTFSFGTTAGVDVPGVPSVPEPGTVTLLGFGLLFLGFVARRKIAASSAK